MKTSTDMIGEIPWLDRSTESRNCGVCCICSTPLYCRAQRAADTENGKTAVEPESNRIVRLIDWILFFEIGVLCLVRLKGLFRQGYHIHTSATYAIKTNTPARFAGVVMACRC